VNNCPENSQKRGQIRIQDDKQGVSEELRRAFWMYKFRHDPEQALTLVYAKDAELARLKCDHKKLEKMWRRSRNP